MNKKIILDYCNELPFEKILEFIQSENDSDRITLEEFAEANLEDDMLKRVELSLCNSLDFNKIISDINSGRFLLNEFEIAGLNDDKLKHLQLQFCNSIEINELSNLIQLQKITIEELERSGLIESKINALKKIVQPIMDKAEFIKEINDKSAYEIRKEINNGNLSFKDLENCLDSDIVNALKYYRERAQEDTPFYKISDFEPLKSNKTDLFFIGLPNSGKSSMLAGISYRANKLGYLFTEPINMNGVKYQDKLIFDLEEKVLPTGTLKGSYNFIATNFNSNDVEDHPYNIIEVPGENYDSMYDKGQADEFLSFISNSKNKKIFIFVVDSNKKGRQEAIFTTIINLINEKGILNRTSAIYVVVNKFDLFNKKISSENNDEEIAFEYLNDNYITFINTLKRNRKDSDNKFKIKILPFSIGTVVHGEILKSYNNKYSDTLINHLIFDSFYIKLK